MLPRQLTFVAVALLLACACAPVYAPVPDRSTTPPAADPASLTYRSVWRESGEVTLTGGLFREPAAPGSTAEFSVRLSDWQVFGAAGGEEVGAVILVTQTGGTGSFYDLALLTRDGNGWVNRDVQPLGDRVAIHALTLEDGEIVVAMTSHGPHDPMCCPTQRVTRRFAVQDGHLIGREEPVATVSAAPALVGPTWQWVRSFYNDDSRTVPLRPEEYTVTFAGDGTVSVKADCNMKGGTYLLNDKALAIIITHSTMAMCPEESLEDRFVRDLTGAAIWFIKDGDLYLDIKHDTGTMRFRQR